MGYTPEDMSQKPKVKITGTKVRLHSLLVPEKILVIVMIRVDNICSERFSLRVTCGEDPSLQVFIG